MRFQERIYIQNEVSSVRNKDIFNVNMSSDICVFESPKFDVSGATKLDCSATTTGATYIISGVTQTIPLTFNFTGDTNSFIETDASFKYEIYKWTPIFSGFSSTPEFRSASIPYSAFSATNMTTEFVPSSALTLDGEFIVKGYYVLSACTEFANLLGKVLDTSALVQGSEFGIYNNALDYYFIAVNAADVPQLTQNISNDIGINKLVQVTMFPQQGSFSLAIPTSIVGDYVVTLNGLALTYSADYTTSTGQVITFNEELVGDDIVTFIYTTAGFNLLVTDNLIVEAPVTSGGTNEQGSNLVFFNTATTKYEIYLSSTPSQGDDILVMVNGVTLAGGIDFYQSTSNPKRIILEGYLVDGDIVTMVYFPQTNLIGGINTNNPVVSWSVANQPQTTAGTFTLQVSSGTSFDDYYFSGNTPYILGVTSYSQGFILTGTVGTNLYYRVKNEKNYFTICGENIGSTAYSETIPITIQSNSINSY